MSLLISLFVGKLQKLKKEHKTVKLNEIIKAVKIGKNFIRHYPFL
jgi:hypothetical protein